METEKTEEKVQAKQPMYPMWRPWRGAWFVFGILIILLAFGAMAMGFHRRMALGTEFGLREGFVTERAIGGPGMRGGMIHARGGMKQVGVNLGIVTKIDGNSLTVRSRGVDQTVTVATSTSFYKNGAVAKQADLQVSDVISVAGAPDSSGNILAQQIVIE